MSLIPFPKIVRNWCYSFGSKLDLLLLTVVGESLIAAGVHVPNILRVLLCLLIISCFSRKVLTWVIPLNMKNNQLGLYFIELIIGLIFCVFINQLLVLVNLGKYWWVPVVISTIFTPTRNLGSKQFSDSSALNCIIGFVLILLVSLSVEFLFGVILFGILFVIGKKLSKRNPNPLTLSIYGFTAAVLQAQIISQNFLFKSDDLIFFDSYSYFISRFGFWSWSGASSIANPYHWFTYGCLGLFSVVMDPASHDLLTTIGPIILIVLLAIGLTSLTIRTNNRSAVLLVAVLLLGMDWVQSPVSPSFDFGIVIVVAILLTMLCSVRNEFLIGLLIGVLLITKVQLFIFASPVFVLLGIRKTEFWKERLKILVFSVFSVFFLGSISYNWLNLKFMSAIHPNIDFGADLLSLAVRDRWSPFSAGNIDRIFGSFSFGNIVLIIILLYRKRLRLISYFEFLFPILISVLFNYMFYLANQEYIALFSMVLLSLLVLIDFDDQEISNLRPGLMWVIIFAQIFSGVVSSMSLHYLLLICPALCLIYLVSRIQRFASAISLILLSAFCSFAFSHLAEIRTFTDSVRKLSEVGSEGNQFAVKLLPSQDLVAATDWLRQNSNPESVIATNYLCANESSCVLDGRTTIAWLSRRRTYIEAERFVMGLAESPYQSLSLDVNYPVWVRDRLRLSTNTICSDAKNINQLKRDGVSFLLLQYEHRSLRNSVYTLCADKVRFANSTVIVLEI